MSVDEPSCCDIFLGWEKKGVSFAFPRPAYFITPSSRAGNIEAIGPSREDNDLEDTNGKGTENFDVRRGVCHGVM